MDTSLFLCLSFILALIITYLIKTSGKKSLPGPPNIPVIGYFIIKCLHSKYTVPEQLTILHKHYGPVVGFNMGMQYLVAVNDLEIAKKILNSEDWQGRAPSYSPWKLATYNKDVGIMFAYGEHWKETRQFCLRILKEVGFGKRNQQEIDINEEFEHFKEYFEKKRIDGHGIVSMNRIFKPTSLNLVWKVLTGKRASEEEKELMNFLIDLVEKLTAAFELGSPKLFAAYPTLGYLIPNLTGLKELIEVSDSLHGIFKEIATKKRKEKTFKNDPKDFIDYYLNKIDECKFGVDDHPIYNDEQMIESCTDMFAAAADTTGNTLEIAIMLMLKHPKVQAKVQAELDAVYPNGETPQYSDVDKLPYTQAALCECVRYYAVTPTIPRTCITDTKLNGCHVPKDTVALLNFQGINRNPKYYDNPDEFKPERFLDKNGCLLKDTSNMVLQFGMGKRICVGMPLAKMSSFAFFASFFQKYSIEESDLFPEIDMKSIKIGITAQTGPLSCLVKVRRFD